MTISITLSPKEKSPIRAFKKWQQHAFIQGQINKVILKELFLTWGNTRDYKNEDALFSS